MAYAAGRVEPRSGRSARASARGGGAGGRRGRRWRRARESSRIAVPSSSASAREQLVRGRRTRSSSRRGAPSQGEVGVGGPAAGSPAAARSASPSRRQPGQGGVGRPAKPSRAARRRRSRLGRRRHDAAAPSDARSGSASGCHAGASSVARQRRPRASSASGVDARVARSASRSLLGPRRERSRPSTSGWNCTPHAVARVTAPPAPRRAGSAPARRAPCGQRGDDVVVPLDGRGGPARRHRAAGRRPPPVPAHRRAAPICWPRGLRRDLAAERDRRELVAEADAERRHARRRPRDRISSLSRRQATGTRRRRRRPSRRRGRPARRTPSRSSGSASPA